jgi:DNA-binding FadR family transcriptional regulator
MERTRPGLTDQGLAIEPLAAANIHEMIQTRLLEFITDRQLTAGDRLPSQASLVQALGVSQAALREAMRALEALGIIEARVGSGWYVSNFSFDAIARGLAYTLDLTGHNFADLLEIRIRLECSYLPEVMRRLTVEDLEGLEGSVREMERLAAAGQDFDAPDRAFHLRLFAGKVQNQLFGEVLDLFWTLYPHISAPHEGSSPDFLLAHVRRHRLILEALRAGDVALAEQRLRDSYQGAVERASLVAR